MFKVDFRRHAQSTIEWGDVYWSLILLKWLSIVSNIVLVVVFIIIIYYYLISFFLFSIIFFALRYFGPP